jgi:hypothetical protein
MESAEKPIRTLPSPAAEGCFSWTGLLLAILVAPLFGLVWAWVAEVAQSYFAPIILFPILLGILAGLSIVGLVRFTQLGHRPTILLAVVLTAAVASAGQHYFGYLAAYSHTGSSVPTSTATGPDLSLLFQQMRPSFGEYICAQARRGRPLLGGYVAQGWLAWLTWAIDGLLGVAGAVAVTIPAVRVPYCNRCRTWYRTIRGGKIDVSTVLRLAELAGVDEIGRPRSPRYRLSACQNGCGPTRCELSWEEPDGTVDFVQVWLDAAGRNQVAAILDGLKHEDYEASSAGGD